MYNIQLGLKTSCFYSGRLYVVHTSGFEKTYIWIWLTVSGLGMCAKEVWIGDGWDLKREVIGISDIGGLLIWYIVVYTEEDISVRCDLGLLERVTGVTLWGWIVIRVWESAVEDLRRAEGYVSEEKSRMVIQWRLFVFQLFRCYQFSSSFVLWRIVSKFWRWYEKAIIFSSLLSQVILGFNISIISRLVLRLMSLSVDSFDHFFVWKVSCHFVSYVRCLLRED